VCTSHVHQPQTVGPPAPQVWHYREADPDLGAWQAKELLDHLEGVLANEPVEVISGQSIVEVKPQVGRRRRTSNTRFLINGHDLDCPAPLRHDQPCVPCQPCKSPRLGLSLFLLLTEDLLQMLSGCTALSVDSG
jgi:Trehalose-phosphatase